MKKILITAALAFTACGGSLLAGTFKGEMTQSVTCTNALDGRVATDLKTVPGATVQIGVMPQGSPRPFYVDFSGCSFRAQSPNPTELVLDSAPCQNLTLKTGFVTASENTANINFLFESTVGDAKCTSAVTGTLIRENQ